LIALTLQVGVAQRGSRGVGHGAEPGHGDPTAPVLPEFGDDQVCLVVVREGRGVKGGRGADQTDTGVFGVGVELPGGAEVAVLDQRHGPVDMEDRRRAVVVLSGAIGQPPVAAAEVVL
jgi:hypothetical protein